MSTLEQINQYVKAENLNDFIKLLKKFSSEFFETEFNKSKDQYLLNFIELTRNIDLKKGINNSCSSSDTNRLKLKWNQSIFNAHLKILTRGVPLNYLAQKNITEKAG